MAEDDRHVEKEEKAEFRKKGGASVGDKDSVVEGELDDMAGSSQESYGQDDSARDKLEQNERRPARP